MIENTPYFVNMFDDKIYRYRSLPSNTPFAPFWDVVIYNDNVNLDLVTDLLSVAKQKENEGLFDNEKWTHYNIFQWDIESINNLKTVIKHSYTDFCNKLGVTPQSVLYINGWIYPQKKGQTLQKHNHSVHENSLLSGNLCLTTNSNKVHYHIPIMSDQHGDHIVDSKAGNFLLFPSYLSHSSTTLQEQTRYVIAFDLITQRGIDTFREYSNNEDDPLFRAVIL